MTDEQAIKIAEQWLHEAATTAGQHNFEKHMAMISKKVQLLGVPGFESIHYDDWYAQCRHQFTNAMIDSIAYRGLNLLKATEMQIQYTVFERVVGTDGVLNEQVVEMMLEKEHDGIWRLLQERVLIENEALRQHKIPES